MLAEVVFKKYIAELEGHYNKQLSDFIKKFWFNRLSELSNEEFIEAVALATCKYQFIPAADQLIKLVKPEQPEENPDAYKEFKVLPSEEMKMSQEQRLENISKIKSLINEALGKTEAKVYTGQDKKAFEERQRSIARYLVGLGDEEPSSQEAPWDEIERQMQEIKEMEF